MTAVATNPGRPPRPPRQGLPPPVARIDRLRRGLRTLVPEPVRAGDLALFRRVAATPAPVVGPLLPRLSQAANRSRLWLATAGLLAVAGGRFGRRAALRGMVAIGATAAVTNLPAKLLTTRQRPNLDLVPEIRRLARVPSSTSFPSGHAASAFAFATGVTLERPRLGIPLHALAAAVAFSRIYTGVHYPGDVLAGAGIGVTVALGTRWVWPLAGAAPAAAAPVTGPVALPSPDGTGLTVVANVAAGNRLRPRPARRLRRLLPGTRIIEAEPGEHFPEVLARAARDARALGIAGGDGSASTAAAVAHAHRLPLLVIPAGTLNHLARDLGVAELEEAAAAVHDGHVAAIDLGEIDGRLFVNTASIGLYPDLVTARQRLERRLGKWPATLWCLLRVMAASDPLHVEIDGTRRRLWLLFVGNGCYPVEGLAPSGRSRLDDGLLDVRLVDADVGWARLRVLASMLIGRLGRCAAYAHWTAATLQVRALRGHLRIATDGESWQGSPQFTVRKRPAALLVLRPGQPIHAMAPAGRRPRPGGDRSS